VTKPVKHLENPFFKKQARCMRARVCVAQTRTPAFHLRAKQSKVKGSAESNGVRSVWVLDWRKRLMFLFISIARALAGRRGTSCKKSPSAPANQPPEESRLLILKKRCPNTLCFSADFASSRVIVMRGGILLVAPSFSLFAWCKVGVRFYREQYRGVGGRERGGINLKKPSARPLPPCPPRAYTSAVPAPHIE